MDCSTFVLLTPITYATMILIGYTLYKCKHEEEIDRLEKENEELLDVISEVEQDFINYKKRISEIFPDE